MRVHKLAAMLLSVAALAAGSAMAQEKKPVLNGQQMERVMRTAAEAGSAEAQFFLAMSKLAGRPEREDVLEGVRLLISAAELKHRGAQFALGSMYLQGGEFTPRNPGKAAALLREAADQGEAAAQNSLGRLLMSGDQGVPRDEKTAAGLFAAAASLGLPIAASNLGMAYINGTGVPKDPEQGARLIYQAADRGVPQAQHNLAWLLEQGVGIRADKAEARRWYALAAEAGNTPSQMNLAIMELNGVGGPQDIVQGMKWMMVVAVSNDAALRDVARKAVADLGKSMTPQQIANSANGAQRWLVANENRPEARP